MSDNKPYRSVTPIKTGDRVVFIDVDGERTEGIARVDSGLGSGFYHSPTRETRVTIIPDGEPMQYGRDFTLGDRHVCDDTCSGGPFSPIPYDEMRRLCGLDPAVKAYCARRDMQKSFSEIGKAMNQVATEIGKGFERFANALTASKPKPKPTPPMWADDPSRQRRPTKTRNHRRVK
uniref:hypothetical protein n=1 Tax=Rhodococcus qingshengii TaxID=334542 RepID=UPI001C4E1F63|nr:hypothetical protein [Rhodococcus qingshengii]